MRFLISSISDAIGMLVLLVGLMMFLFGEPEAGTARCRYGQ
jgi:hypothetical protein